MSTRTPWCFCMCAGAFRLFIEELHTVNASCVRRTQQKEVFRKHARAALHAWTTELEFGQILRRGILPEATRASDSHGQACVTEAKRLSSQDCGRCTHRYEQRTGNKKTQTSAHQKQPTMFFFSALTEKPPASIQTSQNSGDASFEFLSWNTDTAHQILNQRCKDANLMTTVTVLFHHCCFLLDKKSTFPLCFQLSVCALSLLSSYMMCRRQTCTLTFGSESLTAQKMRHVTQYHSHMAAEHRCNGGLQVSTLAFAEKLKGLTETSRILGARTDTT